MIFPSLQICSLFISSILLSFSLLKINLDSLFGSNIFMNDLVPFVASDNYQQTSAVPLDSETHGGEDVPIYARGPWAHLIHGVHEQHYIYHVMSLASCSGIQKSKCSLLANAGQTYIHDSKMTNYILSILVLLFIYLS